MAQKTDFNIAIEELKEYLPQYLEGQSVRISQKRMFKCINPDHQDSNPSCGLVPGTGDKIFHCFSCGATGNIFLAAHYLEGKPLSGRGFISDTVMPLAKQFGILVEETIFTDEQLYEMEVFRAYNNACSIIKSSPVSPLVHEKLVDYGWPAAIRQQMGIGSIKSRKEFLDLMVRQYGHKPEFLKEVDLTSALFNENHLIYALRNEHGAPVGFSARDLNYEAKLAAYEAAESKEGLDKPAKYINTSSKCPIYQKSKVLYNFNIAKKFAPPLYIFEGQPDTATLYSAGLRNSCAICSNSFTLEHLNLILATGIRHLIFVLDADKAGEIGTERFIRLLEDNIGGHVGLRVEIIIMPEGSDDPDSYVRQFGLEKGLAEFRKLEKIDIFAWTLRKGLKEGKDPLALAAEAIPLIVNEQSYLVRMSMIDSLAKQTKLDRDGLWREVLRLVDNDMIKIEEEKTGIARRASSQLLKNPGNLGAIIADAGYALEQVEKRKAGYDPSSIFKATQCVIEQAATVGGGTKIKTGCAVFDEAINGGFPMQRFITVPGKPNQGKSSLLDNLAIWILENNKDVIVLYHSVDDALNIRLPRIQGTKFNIPSKYFEDANKYLQNPPAKCPNFPEVYMKAQNWLYTLVQEERLLLVDVSMLPGILPALESWIKSIRQKFPNKSLIVMGDNFHLYDLPGENNAGEDYVRRMSKFIKRMLNENNCTGFFTMELPKEALRPGVRPRMGKMKGSSGMAFDTNANLGVYNDMKDMGERAELYWSDPNDIEMSYGPNQEEMAGPKKKPIIEVVMDKSKLSAFQGSVFFRFDGETGHLEECSPSEQELMRQKASASQGNKNDQNQGNNNSNPPFQRHI